mmetsp:Transcript_18521/g.37940  ORF Transcript_18521/g.37940 Transcript_18521/m.37940 type:complete len:208 (-) Transcript_18521:616-1239(-)
MVQWYAIPAEFVKVFHEFTAMELGSTSFDSHHRSDKGLHKGIERSIRRAHMKGNHSSWQTKPSCDKLFCKLHTWQPRYFRLLIFLLILLLSDIITPDAIFCFFACHTSFMSDISIMHHYKSDSLPLAFRRFRCYPPQINMNFCPDECLTVLVLLVRKTNNNSPSNPVSIGQQLNAPEIKNFHFLSAKIRQTNWTLKSIRPINFQDGF